MVQKNPAWLDLGFSFCPRLGGLVRVGGHPRITPEPKAALDGRGRDPLQSPRAPAGRLPPARPAPLTIT